VVYDVVQQVFNGSFERGYNRALAIDLFCHSNCTDLTSQADVTQRILDGQAASDNAQKEKGMRLGYMGHLTLIAEEVLKLQDRQPPEILGEQIMERITRDEWIQYLETTLSETRDRDNAVLGGVKPDQGFGARQVGMGANSMLGQGNFSGGNNSTGLSVPADSMALQEQGDATNYDTGSPGLLSGFGNGDDDDDDLEESITGEKREKAVDDDEQVGELSFDDVDYTHTPLLHIERFAFCTSSFPPQSFYLLHFLSCIAWERERGGRSSSKHL
jgi:SIT4-associating protein SAP185/190